MRRRPRACARPGAVLLGSTTTPEFGWKAVTDNPLGHVARNPWNIAPDVRRVERRRGVAAALGMGALHVGTDGGGSIRIPAGFCGIVGLKPTFGRVPAWPLSPFGTVAHLGPMTRTVEDAALMLTVMSGSDLRDWHALPPDGRDYRVGLEGGIAGLRVAVSATLGSVEIDPEVGRVFEAAVAVLADLGARIELVDPPIGQSGSIFARTWFPAAARLIEKLTPEARSRLDPGLAAMAEQGARYSRAEIQDAMLERGDLGVAMQRFLTDYDLLVTPDLGSAGVRGRCRAPRSGPPRALERLGRVQLPVQPYAAAGDHCAGGLLQRWAADRAADRGAQICRCAGAAGGAGVRGGMPAADGGRAARRNGRHGLTRLGPHAWLQVVAGPVARSGREHFRVRGSWANAIVSEDRHSRRGVGHGADRRGGGQDAGVLLGGQPGGLQSSAVHRRHHVRRVLQADLQPAGRVRARRHQDRSGPGRELHGLG